jgi:hypothetical protein
MKKGQLPLIAALALGDTEESTATSPVRKFSGTSNQRHLRALEALLRGPVARESLDRVAGASNGPELVAELRRRGLDVPCHRVPCLDRDGFVVRPGVYALTSADVRKVHKAFASDNARG